MQRLNVLHPINHLAVGGASENTITTCRYSDQSRYSSSILSGQADPAEAQLLYLTREYGIPVHFAVHLQRSIHPVNDLRAYRELARWLKANPCDVVHTHNSKAGVLGRLAAKRAGVPVIVHTIHGWGHHDHMNPLLRAIYIVMERAAARCSQRLIAVSQSTWDRGTKDRIGRPEQYELIHSGIDIARYRDVSVDVKALKASVGIPENAPVIGTVSRLSPQKAPDDFLKVAAAVHKRCEAARFVYVGGGPGLDEFEAGIREMGLEDVILNLGYRRDIPQVLRMFDVFLLTSLWEGLPRVFPQAMCAGLPIVATRVDGAPEAVADGISGFLVPPRDVDGMANFVLQLLADRDLRHSMGQAGLDRVYPDFCDRDMVRRIEAVYEACLSSAGR
jgi:glycosyltransferase involved in cell wall biosynthesis